jgi:hypothetical protein
VPERQVRLERGQVGAVDVERGGLVPAGGQFGADPFGAGLADLIGAARGPLAQDLGQSRVGNDVVAAALTALGHPALTAPSSGGFHRVDNAALRME